MIMQWLRMGLISLATVGLLGLSAMGAVEEHESGGGWKPGGARGGSFNPAHRNFTPKRLEQIQLPQGFSINVFARLEGEPRMITAADDGTVYITRRQQGDVLALRDTDGDGKADQTRTVASDLPGVHGIVLHDGKVYLAATRNVWRATRQSDGSLGKPELIIDDLPPNDHHKNRTMAIGPNEKLYITIGSNTNAGVTKDFPFASILRMNLDGSQREVFSRGLRNTIGFGFHPKTGELWGMDHGADWRGDNTPFEELNHLKQGGDYGWPWVYGKQNPLPLMDIAPPKGDSVKAYAKTTQPAVLTYQAHSAPIEMEFYTGTKFPETYHNDAFVAMHGSWNRKPPVGYKVVRIRFNEKGRPTDFVDFATGWLTEGGKARFGRPAGLAVTPEGDLLVGDDENAVIYRITYDGQ